MEILAGNSNFKAVRERGYYYVDKSQLVAEVLRSGAMVMLITRPRRFGKTLNLSMLECFFQLEADQRHLFAGLAIERDAEAMAHLGAYPTVSLSLKDLDGKTWDDCQIKIKELLASLFLKHKKWIDQANPQYTELRDVNDLLNGKAPLAICENALMLLTRLLQRATDRRVMLLIDEYDTPINAGQVHQYFDKIVDFTRNLLRAGLKDNPALERGVLTGIMRVAKESIFSGLNNVQSYTMLCEPFSAHFGFDEREVNKVLEDFKLTELKDKVAAWYNGYRIGCHWIYNPWSIMSMASLKGKLDIYWVNTSNNELIKKLLTWDRSLESGNLELLLQGKPITRKISESLTLRDIRPDHVWSLLFYSGYLTFEKAHHDGTYDLIIPNLEVRSFFAETIKHWIGLSENWDVIKDALARGDMAAFEKHLSTYFKKTMSFFDVGGLSSSQKPVKRRTSVSPECVYHAVFLGMLIYQQDSYHVSSNRESGLGRYDIVLTPKHAKGTGYIFELKQTSATKLHEEAEEAVRQITKQEYWTSLPGSDHIQRLMLVGVAFCGKRLAMAHHTVDPYLPQQMDPIKTEHVKGRDRDQRQSFRVLLVATESDLGETRRKLATHLKVSGYQVDESAKPCDPTPYQQVILIQAMWWQDGLLAKFWSDLPSSQRLLFLLSPEASWPIVHVEHKAWSQLKSFGDHHPDACRFSELSQLPALMIQRLNKLL